MAQVTEPQVVFCEYNHIYDKSINDTCPYCRQIAEKTDAMKRQLGAAPAKQSNGLWKFLRANRSSDPDATVLQSVVSVDSDDDATVLISPAGKTSEDDDRTEYRVDQSASTDDDATVLISPARKTAGDNDPTEYRFDQSANNDDDRTEYKVTQTASSDDPTIFAGENAAEAAAPTEYVVESTDHVDDFTPQEPQSDEFSSQQSDTSELYWNSVSAPPAAADECPAGNISPEMTPVLDDICPEYMPENETPAKAVPGFHNPDTQGIALQENGPEENVCAGQSSPLAHLIGWLVCISSEQDYGSSRELRDSMNLVDFDTNGSLRIRLAEEDTTATIVFRDKETGIFKIRAEENSDVTVNGRTVCAETILEPYSKICFAHGTYVFFPLVGVCGFEWRQ